MTEELAAAELEAETLQFGDRTMRIGTFPVGIVAILFEKLATSANDG